MDASTRFTLPVIAALLLAAPGAKAQVNITIRLGTPVVISNYSNDAYGDWHSNYTQWRPVTVYFYQGKYYTRSVKGGRPVQIYQRGNERFLPPQDPAWVNHGDKRFNYNRKPNDDDYRQAPAPKSKGKSNGRGRGRGGN
jgi:hypothetical protein